MPAADSVNELFLITYNFSSPASQIIANFISIIHSPMAHSFILSFRICLLTAIFMLFSVCVSAQRLYQISGVELDKGGATLANAWSGGFNNPIVSPIDLDQDSLIDLFIYDKAAFKASAFINNGTVGHPSYRYAPEYDIMFPKDLGDWALVRDYNKDGVPDIFALHGNVNIAVYQGSRIAGGGIAFSKVTDQLQFTFGAAGASGIFVFANNMPVLIDVDFDGDMDILTPDITGTRVSYYQNRSVELGYGTDSLKFILADACWGNVYMNSGCGVSYFSCKTNEGDPPGTPSAQRDGGGSMFGFDYEADHDIDILLADISCNSIKFMRNDGDSSLPNIGYTDTLFPAYDRSVKMTTFPAAFGADVDNDGYQDLLIAPYTANDLYVMKSEDIQCLQYYQNDGPAAPLNRFHYYGDTLLTPTSADVGTESHVVFFDYNGDGLMDIVAGNFGRFRASPSLSLYENTGTATAPRFNEVSNNWSNIGTFNLTSVSPAFGDMDGDGHADMIIGDQMGHIHYFQNAGIDTATYPSMTQTNWFGINAGSGAAPFIYDLNGDSLNDLIIGTVNNNIKYYWNFGTRTSPQFSPDSVNTFLGHVRVSSTPAATLEYTSPMIHKEGNQVFLYTGSREGRIEKYLVSTDSLRQGAFARVSRNVIGISPGRHSTVTIADINGDSIDDYLLGNVRGGLMLFSGAYWGNGISLPTSLSDISHPDSKVLVYPVPARDIVLCRMVSGDDRLIVAQVFDLLGTLVPVMATNDGEGLRLSVAILPAGIYTLRLTSERGTTYQQKISIMK
ncbi:MAG: repeat protein [Bacteroidetes bacterium]|nr:repeat protein [Bacteroidota bacterium]